MTKRGMGSRNGSYSTNYAILLPQQNRHEGQFIEWENFASLHPTETSRSFFAINKDSEAACKVDIPPAGVDFHCVPKMVTEACSLQIK